MSFLGRLGRDLNPFDGPKPPAQPIRTPAPQQQVQQRPMASTAPRPAPSMNPFQRIGNTFHNDVVAPLQRDVVHPAANLATGIAKSTVQAPAYFAKTDIINPARQLMAQATHNPVAYQNAVKAQANTIGATPSQAFGRLAGNTAQLGLAIAAPGVGKAADTAAGKVLGNVAPKLVKPVANIATGTALGGPFNVAGAASNDALTKQNFGRVYGQGTALGAALPAAGEVLHAGVPIVAKAAGTAAKDVATRKPVPSVSDTQLSAANRVSMTRNGFPDSTQPGDVQAYRNIQKKLGVDTNNHDAVDQLILQRQAHGVKMQQRAQSLQSILHPTPLNQSGKALVSEDGSVIPTIKKLAGKGKQAEALVAPTPVSKLAGSSKGSVAEKPQLPPITQNSLSAKARMGRQNISPEVASQVSGEGFVRNTKELQDQAVQNADKQGLNKTIQTAHEALAVEPGKINDATVAHVQQAIERADAAGRTQDAVGLHDALSEHLRKQGQTIQAASLLYKLSPNGLFYKASRDLKKAGTNFTPEMETKLRGLTNDIKSAKTEEAKQQATATFHKFVADNIPKGKAQNALSVWKAGLLSGPLTQAGNFASNATFAGLHGASNPLAAGIDKLISLKTGQRTKTLTTKGILSGAKEGTGKGIGTMKTGIDVRNIEGNKYEVHGELNFKNPVIQNVFGKTSNLVFRGMSAADQPFYYSALKNNLADLAKADGVNQGLKGRALRQHIADTMNSPTTKMAEAAKLAAQKSVLGQDSKIASSISKIAQDHPILQAVVPFVKVPTNFLTRTLDFTPVGAVKTAVKQVRSGKLDQRALSEALAEATTGSAIIGLGAELANNNLLSGQYPSSDPKEVQRWKAEGVQPNSVKIGGKWINLNYMGPVGLLLGAGKDYHTATVKGDSGAAQAIAGFGKSLTGQSFLTGFSGAANAINDPGRYGKNFVHSQAASVVPAWLNAVGNATDSNQRQADSTAQSVAARIPGVRNSLPVKNDVYGNPLKQRTNPLDMSIDPLKPSNDLSKKNPVVAEVNRLHNADQNNTDLQVTPVPVTSLNVEGKTIKLNASQKYALQKQVGQTIQSNWGKLIQTPEYKALNDVDKAKALSNLRTDSTTLAERSYVTANNIATYKKAASSKVVALADGTNNPVNYASTSSKSTPSTTAYYKSPDAEYKALQASYDTKVKSGGYSSDAQKITAEAALAKAKVGASTPKEVRDLYGLSKAQAYHYLTTAENGKDKAKMADQLVAYDKALHDAGLTTYLKYKTGIAPATASGSKKSGSKKVAKLPASMYSGTSKVTNAALAGIKASKGSTKVSASRKVALKTYNPKAPTIKKPKLLRRAYA